MPNVDVLIEGDRIKEVSDTRIHTQAAHTINLHGQPLMPGIIDAHVHVYIAELNLTHNMRRPMTYLAQCAKGFLRHMLSCGFTAIRDVGGGDRGLAHALRDGLVVGPRLFYGERVLSPAGGHGGSRNHEGHGPSPGFWYRSPRSSPHPSMHGVLHPQKYSFAI